MNYTKTAKKLYGFLGILAISLVFSAPIVEAAAPSGSTPVVQPISVSTLPPTSVANTTTVLNGSYQTITATSAIVWFQYGTSAGALTTSTRPSIKPAGSGQFSATAANLTAGTTYFYKAYASYNGVTVPASATVSFTTTNNGGTFANQISTLPPTSINTTSTELNAFVKATAPGTYTLIFKWGLANVFSTNTLSYGDVSGQTGQKSITLSGLTPNTQYSYKACLRDSNGNDQCGSVLVTFTTLSSGGGNPTPYECNDNVDNDGDGHTDYPSDAGCTSSSDNSENSDGTPCTDCGNPSEDSPDTTTLSASNIEDDRATLQGEADPNGDALTSVWFEWGEDEDDLNETTYVSSSNYDDNEEDSTVDFDKTITGLDNNTEYFYRACAENSNGEDCGSVRSFDTDNGDDNNDNDDNNGYVHESPQVIPRIVYKTTTVGSTSSKIMLSIDTRFDNAYSGDTIDYVVTYKNTSGSTLKNSILHIEFPQEVTFRRANEGRYNAKDHTLTLDLETLSPGEHDEIIISVIAESSIRARTELVTKATLAFTMPNSAQEDAIAYAITKVSDARNGNALAGTALFGGDGFLPNSLIEWLILIILMAFMIAGFRYYKHKEIKTA